MHSVSNPAITLLQLGVGYFSLMGNGNCMNHLNWKERNKTRKSNGALEPVNISQDFLNQINTLKFERRENMFSF